MIKFRCTSYSAKTEAAKTSFKDILPYLSLGVGTGSLILSGANLATNKSRQRQDRRYQTQHLDEMKSLSRNLAENTAAMNTMRTSMNDYTTSIRSYRPVTNNNSVRSSTEAPRRRRFLGIF